MKTTTIDIQTLTGTLTGTRELVDEGTLDQYCFFSIATTVDNWDQQKQTIKCMVHGDMVDKFKLLQNDTYVELQGYMNVECSHNGITSIWFDAENVSYKPTTDLIEL